MTVIAPAQLSLTTTAEILGAGISDRHSIIKGPGQVIAGGVLSRTVMVWTQVPELLQLSVAFHVRVIV
jgi:hypothetical protein